MYTVIHGITMSVENYPNPTLNIQRTNLLPENVPNAQRILIVESATHYLKQIPIRMKNQFSVIVVKLLYI